MGIYGLKINDVQEEDYDIVKITHIGFVDEYGERISDACIFR